MSNASHKREGVRAMLQILGSEEQQLAYEHDVPHVDITVELLCLWFDDLYHGMTPSDDSTFYGTELAAISEFHRFYDERTSQLPESRGTVRTWLANPVWQEIMEQARRTLELVAAE